MLWAKLVNGELIYAPPEIYDEEGVVKELKSHDDFVNAGYKRVIKRKPPYDPNTQCLALDEIIDKDDIYIIYKVKTLNIDMSTSVINEIIKEEINK